MRLAHIAAFLICASTVAGESDRGELSSVVSGLRYTQDIARSGTNPLNYLSSLKPRDVNASLTPHQRYQLALTLLDVHHLCKALFHQTYYLEPVEKYPILNLAEKAFPGFRDLSAGDGYNTGKIATFLETNGALWSPR